MQIYYDWDFDFVGLYEIYRRTSCWCCSLQRIDELWKLRIHRVYDKEYSIFHKFLSAYDKRIPLGEIIDCIDKIIVDADKKIVVK